MSVLQKKQAVENFLVAAMFFASPFVVNFSFGL